jgi:hypothetical protein
VGDQVEHPLLEPGDDRHIRIVVAVEIVPRIVVVVGVVRRLVVVGVVQVSEPGKCKGMSV